MKDFFILINGKCDGLNLSHEGEEQISKFAKEMKVIVGESYNGIYLASSPFPSAIGTGYIIAEAFNLTTFEKNEQLGVTMLLRDQIEAIDKMIEPHKNNDLVTIVTHYKTMLSYFPHIAKTLLGKYESLGPIREGEGVHFDVKNKIYQRIPKIS